MARVHDHHRSPVISEKNQEKVGRGIVLGAVLGIHLLLTIPGYLIRRLQQKMRVVGLQPMPRLRVAAAIILLETALPFLWVVGMTGIIPMLLAFPLMRKILRHCLQRLRVKQEQGKLTLGFVVLLGATAQLWLWGIIFAALATLIVVASLFFGIGLGLSNPEGLGAYMFIVSGIFVGGAFMLASLPLVVIYFVVMVSMLSIIPSLSFWIVGVERQLIDTHPTSRQLRKAYYRGLRTAQKLGAWQPRQRTEQAPTAPLRENSMKLT